MKSRLATLLLLISALLLLGGVALGDWTFYGASNLYGGFDASSGGGGSLADAGAMTAGQGLRFQGAPTVNGQALTIDITDGSISRAMLADGSVGSVTADGAVAGLLANCVLPGGCMIQPSYGTAAGSIAQGNDTRIANAVQTSRQLICGPGIVGCHDLSTDITLAVSSDADAVRVASNAALPANTFVGISCAATTITMTSVGVLTIDGVATVINDVVLVKNERSITSVDEDVCRSRRIFSAVDDERLSILDLRSASGDVDWLSCVRYHRWRWRRADMRRRDRSNKSPISRYRIGEGVLLHDQSVEQRRRARTRWRRRQQRLMHALRLFGGGMLRFPFDPMRLLKHMLVAIGIPLLLALLAIVAVAAYLGCLALAGGSTPI